MNTTTLSSSPTPETIIINFNSNIVMLEVLASMFNPVDGRSSFSPTNCRCLLSKWISIPCWMMRWSSSFKGVFKGQKFMKKLSYLVTVWEIIVWDLDLVSCISSTKFSSSSWIQFWFAYWMGFQVRDIRAAHLQRSLIGIASTQRGNLVLWMMPSFWTLSSLQFLQWAEIWLFLR